MERRDNREPLMNDIRDIQNNYFISDISHNLRIMKIKILKICKYINDFLLQVNKFKPLHCTSFDQWCLIGLIHIKQKIGHIQNFLMNNLIIGTLKKNILLLVSTSVLTSLTVVSIQNLSSLFFFLFLCFENINRFTNMPWQSILKCFHTIQS